ncbi:MAG: hypothetical protein AAFQ07_14140 [Chloroflexota bacterium]
MLQAFDTMQNFADALKGIVLDATAVEKGLRLDTLRTINKLEGAGWNPHAMQEAIEQLDMQLIVDGQSISTTSDPQAFMLSVGELYTIYSELIGYQHDPFHDIFDMKGAADYLGISYEMMKTYVSREKRIRGSKFGRSIGFTRAQLDHFRDNEMRQPGRPAESEV